MTTYLILSRLDTGDHEHINAGRCSEKSFTLTRMREALEKHFPEYEILNPVERTRSGDVAVSVWLSVTKEGRGRVNKIYAWAIRPK